MISLKVTVWLKVAQDMARLNIPKFDIVLVKLMSLRQVEMNLKYLNVYLQQ